MINNFYEKLEGLRGRVQQVDVSAPGMNAVTDILLDLIQVVLFHDAAVWRIEKATKAAANTASCLANGIKPD